jgi:signal transduction histidine kinase/ActR/RegA family two-component response regulator
VQQLEGRRLRSAVDVVHAALRRNEEALLRIADSERRYADVAAVAPGAVYEFEIRPDGSRAFTLMTEGAWALFERPPSDFLADVAVIFRMVDPPSQLEALEASIARSQASLQPWEFEATVRTGAGHVKWIRGHSIPSPREDGTVRWRGVFTDITTRVATERALQESQAALQHSLSLLQGAFESTADGLLVVDASGRVTGYNQKFLSLWRVPPALADTTNNRQLLSHVADQLADPEAFVSKVKELYGRPDAVSFDLLRFRDGRCFERYSQPQVVEGTVVGRVWSFRDVTSRIDEARRLAELEQQLQQAQTLEALGALSGGVAHDFNNLLTIILGNVDQALSEQDDTLRRENLAAIHEAAVRASALVRQIREFSQPRAVARSVVMVADAVRSAVQLLQTAMPKNIEVVHELCPAVTMFANPMQVQQVVTNLVLNAAQAINEAPGCIAIRLEEVSSTDVPPTTPAPLADRYARLTVRDTGRGIAAEVMPRLFEPVFTTKAAEPGSGLGLAVVNGIVRRHHGAIVVDSAPGRGTVFQVFWPALAPASPGASAPAAPAEAVSSIWSGEDRHVLVVDDESDIVKLLTTGLRRLGYRVTSTEDPREAAAIFCQAPVSFDAVLTDLSMPHMSGVDLGRRILALRPETPVILFTGYSAELGPDEMCAIGFRAVLNKPVTLPVLAEELHRALGPRPAPPAQGA